MLLASAENTAQQLAPILERLTKVETALDTEGPHLATLGWRISCWSARAAVQ